MHNNEILENFCGSHLKLDISYIIDLSSRTGLTEIELKQSNRCRKSKRPLKMRVQSKRKLPPGILKKKYFNYGLFYFRKHIS